MAGGRRGWARFEENKELRGILDFSKERNYSLTIANVLSRDEINKNILIIVNPNDYDNVINMWDSIDINFKKELDTLSKNIIE